MHEAAERLFHEQMVGGYSSCDVIAPWLDPTWPFFCLLRKIVQSMLHKLSKVSARFAKRLGAHIRKSSWGHIPSPLTGEAQLTCRHWDSSCRIRTGRCPVVSLGWRALCRFQLSWHDLSGRVSLLGGRLARLSGLSWRSGRSAPRSPTRPWSRVSRKRYGLWHENW